MTKPAGQEAQATVVPPATAASDDPFGLAPWLKEMPHVAIPPLMAHPVAAMAAATAIGFGFTSQLAGAVIGAMQGSAERMKAVLDEAARGEGRMPRQPGPAAPESAQAGAGAGGVATRPAPKPEGPPAGSGAVPAAARAGRVRAATEGKKAAGTELRPPVAKSERPATVRKGSGPKAGKADDLKAISGVGPKLEQALNGKGIFRFAEIARWTGADVEKIEAELGLDGRIARDGWVEQARALAKAKG